jgi:hypothetical protein
MERRLSVLRREDEAMGIGMLGRHARHPFNFLDTVLRRTKSYFDCRSPRGIVHELELLVGRTPLYSRTKFAREDRGMMIEAVTHHIHAQHYISRSPPSAHPYEQPHYVPTAPSTNASSSPSPDSSIPLANAQTFHNVRPNSFCTSFQDHLVTYQPHPRSRYSAGYTA